MNILICKRHEILHAIVDIGILRIWEVSSVEISFGGVAQNVQVESNSAIYLSFEVVAIVSVTLVRERHLAHPFLGALELVYSWDWTMSHVVAGSVVVKTTFARERELDLSGFIAFYF